MKLLCAASAIALCGTAATAATFSFDTNAGAALSDGDLLQSFDFGGGVSGSLTVINAGNPNLSSPEARIFDTTLDDTFDSDLEGDFTNATDSSDVRGFGNALIIQERPNLAEGIPDDERAGGSIQFRFDNAIDLTSIIYLDGEEGYDVTSGGTLLGSLGSGISGDNLFAEVSFGTNATNITEFTVVFNGSGAIGSFDANVSAVPIPAALPLMLLGLGGLGALRRRKKAA